jgi:transposase
MIRITFTESDIEQLRYERFHHPHPRVQRKMEAVLLKSEGISHKNICNITGVCGNTIRTYFRDYADGGIERLKEVNFHKPESELNQYKGTIENYFQEHPPAGIKEAMSAIEQLTGVKRSENRVREYLKKIGMKRRKIGMIPAKADPERQELFLREELNPRLKEAEEGRRTVFLSTRRISS